MSVFLACLYDAVLQCIEAVGCKAPKPVWCVKEVIVALFLVHGLHDLVDLDANGGVVTAPPVQESIIPGGRRVEVVRAPNVHNAVVARYDVFGDAVQSEESHDRRDVAVFPRNRTVRATLRL